MNEIFEFLTSFPISTRDAVTLIPIFILTIMLFHYSNKEMKKSLEQSKMVQEILSKDRDTLRKELKEAKLKRLSDLARAVEFGRLAQGIFHDLMTPLSSMVLHTEKLKEAEASAAKQNIEKAIDASRKMASYIKDIRATLSREESERDCILSEETESVIHFFGYMAKENGIEIKTSCSPDIIWYGSPTKFRQIISNLISNSIDSFEHSTNKVKKVEVSLKKKRDHVILRVSDNGCGIPEEKIDRIFEAFYTTKPADKGTGIGLTTIKSIVEKNLNGYIELKSKEGKGTSFTITFPLSNTNPAASHQPPHIEPDLV